MKWTLQRESVGMARALTGRIRAGSAEMLWLQNFTSVLFEMAGKARAK